MKNIEDRLNESYRAIIKDWQMRGQETFRPKYTQVILPRHPEFVYRISGKWTGWNDFLCTQKDQAPIAFNNNLKMDRIEDAAFALWSRAFKNLN